MNSKRIVGWLAFFGVAAALAWGTGYLQPVEEGAAGLDAVTAANNSRPLQGVLPAATVMDKSVPIRDLSPAGDLFSAHSWQAAAVLATVTEQPVDVMPIVQAPAVPPMPFEFVGRLDDRRDLQVFLQDGEKIYVVRKGDVIDKTWRIEGISDKELSFVYLPLRLSQTLSVGNSQ